MTPQQVRLFSIPMFYKHLLRLIDNFGGIAKAMRRNLIDKAFREKIMLAVTQVNGCRYCNYYHTKLSIDAGIEKSEIEALLNGELGNINDEEVIGLMFAQHYADTNGEYDPETYQKFMLIMARKKEKTSSLLSWQLL